LFAAATWAVVVLAVLEVIAVLIDMLVWGLIWEARLVPHCWPYGSCWERDYGRDLVTGEPSPWWIMPLVLQVPALPILALALRRVIVPDASPRAGAPDREAEPDSTNDDSWSWFGKLSAFSLALWIVIGVIVYLASRDPSWNTPLP
jgi:hypothetical protein